MYKHGRPIERFTSKPIAVIICVVVLLLVVGYLKFIGPQNKSAISNVSSPLVSTVKAANENTAINEADFSFTLPGKWALAQKDWDSRYHAWQWESSVKNGAGRWFRLYLDTIPNDYAYNFLLPVSANGTSLSLGAMSGKCSDFTTTQQVKTSNGTFAALARWQQTNFYCDMGNDNFQVVGTSSPAAINSVSLSGPASGSHKYFFLYQDSNFNPDYGLLANILASLHAK